MYLFDTRICGIKPGDSKSKVTEVLAKPNSIASLNQVEEWQWIEPTLPHYVRFVGKQVAEINGGPLSVGHQVFKDNCSLEEFLEFFPSLRPDVKLNTCETYLTSCPGLELRVIIFVKGRNKFILKRKPGLG